MVSFTAVLFSCRTLRFCPSQCWNILEGSAFNIMIRFNAFIKCTISLMKCSFLYDTARSSGLSQIKSCSRIFAAITEALVMCGGDGAERWALYQGANVVCWEKKGPTFPLSLSKVLYSDHCTCTTHGSLLLHKNPLLYKKNTKRIRCETISEKMLRGSQYT